jgi:MYXO-CTERM domain-containing protein
VELEGAQHVMLGPDQHVGSDAWLVSPPIAVGTSPFGISFRQRHQFEAEPALLAYFDGGVLELSQDGGASWVDIGATARIGSDPAYTETPLLVYAGNVNPLAGRRAFAGESPGYPAFSTVTLDLGTTHSNQTVRIRFRVGTDELFGLAGWEIDDLALAGVTGLPFPGLVDDQLVCGNGGAVASAGAAQRVAERSMVTLDGTGSAAENPGAVLTYAWTQTGGPGVTLTGANTPAPTFTAPEVTAETVLTFELAVSDGTSNATASTEVTVVDVNRAPLAEAGTSRTVDENTLVTLDGSASSDPDPGSTLTYAWELISEGEVTLSATDAAVVTFTAPDLAATSDLVFRLTVSDGTLSGISEVTITIRDLDGGSAGDGGGGCGCGSGGAAGEFALVGLAALLRRRRRTGGAG